MNKFDEKLDAIVDAIANGLSIKDARERLFPLRSIKIVPYHRDYSQVMEGLLINLVQLLTNKKTSDEIINSLKRELALRTLHKFNYLIENLIDCKTELLKARRILERLNEVNLVDVCDNLDVLLNNLIKTLNSNLRDCFEEINKNYIEEVLPTTLAFNTKSIDRERELKLIADGIKDKSSLKKAKSQLTLLALKLLNTKSGIYWTSLLEALVLKLNKRKVNNETADNFRKELALRYLNNISNFKISDYEFYAGSASKTFKDIGGTGT